MLNVKKTDKIPQNKNGEILEIDLKRRILNDE